MNNFTSNSLSSVFLTCTTKYLRKIIFCQPSGFYIMTLSSQAVSFTRQFSATNPITVLTSIFARPCLAFLNMLRKKKKQFFCAGHFAYTACMVLCNQYAEVTRSSPLKKLMFIRVCFLVLVRLRPIRHLFCLSVCENQV